MRKSRAVDAYLLSRRSGGGALDNFWIDRVEDVDRIRRELAPRGRADHLWSCSAISSGTARCSDGTSPSRQWATGCCGGIAWAAAHPDLDLVIRIHPAEVGLRNHPTRERMADHITAHVPRRCHRTSASSRPRIRRARMSSWTRRASGSCTHLPSASSSRVPARRWRSPPTRTIGDEGSRSIPQLRGRLLVGG